MSVTPVGAPVRPAYFRDADGLYYRVGGGGGEGAGGSAYMGVWNPATAYPAGATVFYTDGQWGADSAIAAGNTPADPSGVNSVPVGTDALAAAPTVLIAADGANVSSGAFSNVGLTIEAGEPSVRYRSAWWKYAPITSGSVQFDTIGSGGDTQVHIYSGPATGATFAGLSQVAYDDESGGSGTSKTTYAVTAGFTYYLRVMAFTDITFNYVLNLVGARATAQPAPAWRRLSIEKTAGDARYVNVTGDTITGALAVDGGVNLNAAAGVGRSMTLQTDWATRWAVGRTGTAEGGSNTGSNFNIGRYSDAGTWIADAVTIQRSTGDVYVEHPITMIDPVPIATGHTTSKQYVDGRTPKIVASTTAPTDLAAIWIDTN